MVRFQGIFGGSTNFGNKLESIILYIIDIYYEVIGKSLNRVQSKADKLNSLRQRELAGRQMRIDKIISELDDLFE